MSTTVAFSTNETLSLERNVTIDHPVDNITEIWTKDRLLECKSWIAIGQYKKVCIQFPDEFLEFSTKIADDLAKIGTDCQVYVLGDTSYGSCCVDEIAAAHIGADAIIHFGHACLSKVNRLPVLYIFPNYDLNIDQFIDQLSIKFNTNPLNDLIIFYNVGYYYYIDKIKRRLLEEVTLKDAIIVQLAIDCEPDILCWKLNGKQLDKCTCLYLGEDNHTFFNLTIATTATQWLLYDPAKSDLIQDITPMKSRWMQRRYYYVEKCKDARTIGIVVATLTAKGYLDIVKHLQTLARKRGMRAYIFSVGKVNPPKLANFMEIDCFVMIGCPENSELLKSRDFYKPLVTPFELELALNPAWHEQLPDCYYLDYQQLTKDGKYYRPYDETMFRNGDVSLLTGRVRQNKTDEPEKSVQESHSNDGSLELRKPFHVMQIDTMGSLQSRTWTGLDPSFGLNEPAKIEKGRSGIPIKYDDDNSSNS